LGATLLAINQRHERLIDGLLTLASSEQALTEPSPTDLADIARHVLAQPYPPTIRLQAELQPAEVVGDPVLLERLTANLIDNAMRYNLPEDGLVNVRTRLTDGCAEMLVENSGPTIATYEIPGLFEPFRRLSGTDRHANAGSGLGLSIVQAITRAHGGSVHAEPRAGGGLRIVVCIPVAQRGRITLPR
jgi:signal transduction histidine kinase